MAFFEPLSVYLQGMFDLPVPYVNAVAFSVIWAAVVWSFGHLVVAVLRANGTRMKFRHQRPGRLLMGLLSAFVVCGTLSVCLVMLPVVQGSYFQKDAQPPAGLHRAAGGLYRVLTFSPTNPVPLAQMEAGGFWAQKRISELLKTSDLDGAAQVVYDFENRYWKHIARGRPQQRREEILTQLIKAARLDEDEDEYEEEYEEEP